MEQISRKDIYFLTEAIRSLSDRVKELTQEVHDLKIENNSSEKIMEEFDNELPL